MDAKFLELGNYFTPDVMRILHYFAKDTTERILRNISRMDMMDSGALERSIHSTVYSNAAGNDALVRFYYLYYAKFVENAVGAYFVVDDDLAKVTNYKTKSKTKRKGVKHKNVAPIAPISGSNFDSIPTTMHGISAQGGGSKPRGEYHRAKPAIQSEIRLHLRSTQRRLAVLCGFTATAYLLNSLVRGTSKTYDRSAGKGASYDRAKAANPDMSDYAVRFTPDMSAEESWLQAQGYLKHIEKDWGLSSFSIANL